MSDKKMTTIFNQKLCGFLMQKGFVLVAMAENKHYAGKNVFFFNESYELHRAIKEFKYMKSNEQIAYSIILMYKETNDYGTTSKFENRMNKISKEAD